MSRIIDVARSYCNTPHINGAQIKGAGCDCCTLPVMIYKELGLADIPIKKGYPADWFCQKDCKEILLPYLEKYFYRVEEIKELDLVSYSWGRSSYAHISMYLGNGLYIHASADAGAEIVDENEPYFYDAKGRSRVTGIWRLKK